ncbi:Alpha/Beta hydrolase protein [Mariannaea sp. PMI_226]|nr:Alpha/Beta hydrolase protein [Mariannaea sp. PMI_226]
MADFHFIRLLTKPSAEICYRFYDAASQSPPVLLVFLNGLGLPQAAWAPTITKLQSMRGEKNMPFVLTYDRFGQGQTLDRDPQDAMAPDQSHGHDSISAVRDLRQLLVQIVGDKMEILDTNSVTIVFVANSLGCALARLYAQEYPRTVAGLLLLDSVLANSDFVSMYPDPDDEAFRYNDIPEGITPDSLRAARARIRAMFHPDVANKEGLSRRNLAKLLPASDSPSLEAPDTRGPFVTVIGHDFEAFAEESEKMGHPKLLTRTYVNPYWNAYNEGLTKITDPERSKGPLQSPHSGHFVQKDNPVFVAKELDELLSRIM